MKKVLIAIDYSATSQQVAEAGYNLANSMNAQVVLLHVITEPIFYSMAEFMPIMGFAGYADTGISMLNNKNVMKNVSQDYLEHVKSLLHDPSILAYVKEGDFPKVIVDFAQEINADLIVLGSHIYHFLEDILMGSVAEKVLHYTQTPLFIIPAKEAIVQKKRARPHFEIKQVSVSQMNRNSAIPV
jgi:nucleotide-binding universal stress UspA family protein